MLRCAWKLLTRARNALSIRESDSVRVVYSARSLKQPALRALPLAPERPGAVVEVSLAEEVDEHMGLRTRRLILVSTALNE